MRCSASRGSFDCHLLMLGRLSREWVAHEGKYMPSCASSPRVGARGIGSVAENRNNQNSSEEIFRLTDHPALKFPNGRMEARTAAFYARPALVVARYQSPDELPSAAIVGRYLTELFLNASFLAIHRKIFSADNRQKVDNGYSASLVPQAIV